MSRTDKYDPGIQYPNRHHGVVTWEEIENSVGFSALLIIFRETKA